MKEHYVWVEKYRPNTLDQFIAEEELKIRVSGWVKEGQCPHLIFAGSAGTGKTALGKLLIKLLDAESLVLNASDERGIDTVRERIKRFAMVVPLKPIKIVLLDEASETTPDFQHALRSVIEDYSKDTRFILTCNYLNKIIEPIRSRCKVIKISSMPKKEMAKRIATILAKEKVKCSVENLKEVINLYYPDMRSILNTLQYHRIGNEIKIDYSTLIAKDFKLKIWKGLEEEKFNEIRQVVADNPIQFVDLYRFLFDKYANEGKIKEMVIIAEYLWRAVFTPDEEITFLGCVIELMDLK